MPQENPPRPMISRVSRSREEARATYNGISKWYDALTGTERYLVEAGVDELAPAQGTRVLEVGYGTGHALVRLARAVGSGGRVYGIDISEGMRAVAESRMQSADLSSRVHLATADATHLPFASGHLDALFMSFTLELFDTPEIPLVLAECKRVLTPEGRICVVSMAAQEHPGFSLRLYEWAHERFPKAVDCRPILARQSLETAGFRIVAASRGQVWGLPLETCVAMKGCPEPW